MTLIKFIVSLLIVLSVCACGQKGALIRPENPTFVQKEEADQTAPKKSNEKSQSDAESTSTEDPTL